MTDQFPDDRAEQAARDWFARQASGAVPGSIDPAAVRAASDRRQRLRFTGALAAAAVLLAALVIVPMALRPADPPITGVPGPSASEPSWTTTAPSPLTPRWGSLTAWLDGRFYVIGGWDGGPCPPGAACDMPGPNLRDGAVYDPANDTWTTIAEAPYGIGRDFSLGVTLQGALYVASVIDDGSFWAYHPDTDEWQRLAEPPGYHHMVATTSMIVVDTLDDPSRHYAYRPSEDAWVQLPEGPIDRCYGVTLWAVEERALVVGGCGDDGAELQLSFFDPDSSEWSQPVAVPGAGERYADGQGGDAVYVAGSLVWPRRLWTFSSVRSPGIYDIESQTWREVPPDITPGALSYRGLNLRYEPLVFSGLGLVEANGNLLDVRTATWLKVPQEPVPDRWDPVEAVGPDSLLSCFGYHYSDDAFDGGRFALGCQLLTVGSTVPTSPTASPQPPTATGRNPTNPTEAPSAGPLTWREIASPDSNPRSDALLVAVQDSFYLMGGHRPAPDGDEEQIPSGYRLDPAQGSGSTAWTPIAALPQVSLPGPYRMMADVAGATMYVHFVFEELGELWAYDTAADSWRKIEDTGEGDSFIGTEDGLVKRQSDYGSPVSQLRLLVDGRWVELPEPDMGRGVFRLGDHQLGYLTGNNRVAVLDTATRSWQAPSEPGEVGSHDAYGVDGAAVFVYPPDSEGELMPNHKYGLNVLTLVNGAWAHPEPLLTDGGLGSQIGAITGRWIVISGNLFDPRAQEWLPVPAIPGSDYQWVSPTVAGGPQGVLSCFPIRDIDEPEPRAVDSCYLLTVP